MPTAISHRDHLPSRFGDGAARCQGRVRRRGQVPTTLTSVVHTAALGEARRHRVLKAARVTFARYGYRRTSMEAIAQAADMSRPALYQHLSNKEAVFRDLRHPRVSLPTPAYGERKPS
ncbi:helix-turn-helix domain-containing protein [Micromonospora zamorensis]|uniref:TetR/AcrR family transcriptional regulator n=1 Tax=Micromonospora zamorensis TaxID=709883 RepID=A0ABZ1PPN7_9ACTN